MRSAAVAVLAALSAASMWRGSQRLVAGALARGWAEIAAGLVAFVAAWEVAP